MRALQVILPLLAVVAGCVSRVDSWTRYPRHPGLEIVGGVMTNNTGQTLHHLKITGRIWTHKKNYWLQPAIKTDAWRPGEKFSMCYKWSEIDGVRLTVYSDEGKWWVCWPLDPAKPE